MVEFCILIMRQIYNWFLYESYGWSGSSIWASEIRAASLYEMMKAWEYYLSALMLIVQALSKFSLKNLSKLGLRVLTSLL